MVDNPRTDGGWGNTVAGPIFNAIAEESARHLGVQPFNMNAAPEAVRERMKRIKPVPPPSVKYGIEPAVRETASEAR